MSEPRAPVVPPTTNWSRRRKQTKNGSRAVRSCAPQPLNTHARFVKLLPLSNSSEDDQMNEDDHDDNNNSLCNPQPNHCLSLYMIIIIIPNTNDFDYL